MLRPQGIFRVVLLEPPTHQPLAVVILLLLCQRCIPLNTRIQQCMHLPQHALRPLLEPGICLHPVLDPPREANALTLPGPAESLAVVSEIRLPVDHALPGFSGGSRVLGDVEEVSEVVGFFT